MNEEKSEPDPQIQKSAKKQEIDWNGGAMI